MIMPHLEHGVSDLEVKELQYAQRTHGEYFANFADGHLALSEEVQEAMEDWMCVQAACECLMRAYRQEGGMDTDVLLRIERKALHGACELIQVATVARKMIESEGCYAAGCKSVCERLP